MRYDNSDLQDQLAAQYALGALTGPARRRLESLMPARPALQARVSAWEDRLAPLTDTAPPIVPPGHVLTALHRRLFHGHKAQKTQSRWDRVAPWRWLAGAALATAVALMAYVIFDLGFGNEAETGAGTPSYVAVLRDESATPGLVVTVFDQPWRLAVEPLETLSAPEGSVLRIWAVERGTGATRTLLRVVDRAPVELAMSTEMWSLIETAESLFVSLDDADARTPGPTLYAGLCIHLKGLRDMHSGPASGSKWPNN